MNAQIISFNCILKNKLGLVISSTYNHDVLTSIADDKASLSGLSKGLMGLTKGENRIIELGAAEAYGFYDPKKVILFPRKKLLKSILVGDAVAIAGKSGKIRNYKVIDILPDMVSLDENHPLAGQDLIFEIETLSARPATHAEIDAASNNVSKQHLH